MRNTPKPKIANFPSKLGESKCFWKKGDSTKRTYEVLENKDFFNFEPRNEPKNLSTKIEEIAEVPVLRPPMLSELRRAAEGGEERVLQLSGFPRFPRFSRKLRPF
jgi:hypothetical protein